MAFSLVAMGVFVVICVLPVLVFLVLVGVVMLISGAEGSLIDASFGEFVIVMLLFGAVMAVFLAVLSASYGVAAVEFDLAEGRLAYTETSAWWRTRVRTVALQEVLSLWPCLEYENDREGSFSVQVRLPGGEEKLLDFGQKMPVDTLQRHADWLRPALGERVKPTRLTAD
ncbi:hypothetical protein OOT46_28515 [Aquabacterium sp. A7-Y]|uniref:hypothetical protein n=1 Tax=Aquabacterium sp. A7-Y TaxID=1349605 RepID=UPI00223E81D7|nr:hypothetical protein [Aquabacterium sp. A7-Y]MCW7541746.1 hypothetical protein [Aquabacterium sp. A7-Y]